MTSSLGAKIDVTRNELGTYKFCSERFKSLCEKDDLKGIQFMDLALVPNYLQSIVN
ncbi:hypothetical protein LSPH24S_07429 [Lysinibacillus sphaericus]|nr:hypothetical protein LSP03_18390 [Lysinibacillus sphaericus]